MLLQNGLKMWGKHSKPSSGGTMARFKNLCGHVIWKLHAFDDIHKNLVDVSVVQDKAANHGTESTERPLQHFPKYVTEKNGPERFGKRLDTGPFIQLFVFASAPLVWFTNPAGCFEAQGSQKSSNGLGITHDEFWRDLIWTACPTTCGVECLLFNVKGRGDTVGLQLGENTAVKVTGILGMTDQILEPDPEAFFNAAKMICPFVGDLPILFCKNSF